MVRSGQIQAYANRVRVKTYVEGGASCLVKVFFGTDTSRENYKGAFKIRHYWPEDKLVLDLPDNFPGDACVGSGVGERRETRLQFLKYEEEALQVLVKTLKESEKTARELRQDAEWALWDKKMKGVNL